ncbi:MAG: response regulator, partial [Rikenellaceae bacterium]|nr:response regulator [Rikenellaceae bacterium]
LDGYAATREIRGSAHPQAKTIPIVAMTANAFSEDVTAALSAGMNDHVAKPVSYDRLYQVLSRLTDTGDGQNA